MKCKKVLKKILLYLGAFVAVLSVSAGLKVGIFLINRPANVGPADSQEDDNPQNEVLTKVLNSMLTTERADIDLNLQLKTQNASPINLNSKVYLNLPSNAQQEAPQSANFAPRRVQAQSSTQQFKVALNGDIEFNNQIVPYDINYVNGIIYIKFGDAMVKVETSNMAQDLDTLLNYALLKKFGLNVSLPNLSGLNFNASMLSALASQLTETDLDNGKEIKFNIMGMGWATMLTDSDYVLKSIKLEELDFNGTKISAEVEADLNAEPKQVNEPENKEELTDLTGLTQFLGVADKVLDKGYISGVMHLNALGLNVFADYNFNFEDFNNIKAYFKTSVAGNDLVLQYQNNTIYMSYDDCKYFFTSPFDFDEIIDTINFYAKKFGIEFPQDEFNSFKEIININDLNQMLSLISNLQIDGNGLTWFKDGLNLNISVKDGEFNNIHAGYKDAISLDISVNQKVNVPLLNANEYKNILDEDLFGKLHEQLVKNKQLALKANIKVDNTNIEALLTADFVDEIKLQLKVKVLNQQITLTVIDDVVYLEVGNMLKAKGSLEDIWKFIKSANLLEIESENIDFEAIKDAIISQLNSAGVSLKFLKQNNNVQAFDILKDNVHCRIFAVDFEEINFEETGKYEDMVELCEFTKTLLNNLNNKPLAFNISADYADYHITGQMQYISSKFVASLSTNILNKQINVIIEDNLLYLNIDGLKIKCSVSDIKELAQDIQNAFNLDITDLVDSLDFDLDKLLEQIKVTIKDGELNISLNNFALSVNASSVSANIESSNFSGEISLGKTFEQPSHENYLDFLELKPLFKATINTLKNASVSGQVDVTLNLFNEDNLLNIDYSVAFVEQKLIGYISTTFKGLNVKAYIDGKDIYVDVVGLKLHLNIDQIPEIIDWVNQTFKTNISFDLNDLISKEKIEDLHFDIIKSILSTPTNAQIEFKDNFKIIIDFDSYIRKAKFLNGDKSALLTCTDFNKINLDSLNKADYSDYTKLTKVIESAYSLIMSKQYDISAHAQKFKDDALTNSYTANLTLDATGALNAYLDLLGLGEQITVGYENKILYFRYGGEKGMKIAVQEQALQEILSIVCSALNIDVSSIPLLNDFLQSDNIDTSNLETILPKFELGNPLQYLEYIKHFDITDSYFEIVLRAEKLGDYAKDKDVAIVINYQDSTLTSISVTNLFINQTQNEYVNIDISINPFSKVEKVLDKNKYIDLSNSKDLIRAFVNTSNLNDWNIVGNVKLDIKLGSLELKAATIKVDVKVKLDSDKKPMIAVELSNYPLIGALNNKNTNGVGGTGLGAIKPRYRTISIYYKDGEMYLKTFDEKWGAYKELTRTTKITLQYFIDNLSYYTQYLFGFTDTIQSKINEAIQKSQSYEGDTDYGNIILSYNKSGNSHTFEINLAEVAHNSDIGTLTLVLTTINNESTQNKDYLYRIDLDLKILDNMLSLKTDSSSQNEGLYLNDIGSQVSLSNLDDIINLYEQNGFGLDGEYEKTGSNAWKKDSTGTSQVTFISNCQEVKTISGDVASKIPFPQMNNYIFDDNVIWQELKFDGWFYDEQFNIEFENDTFPRYNTTLYAKWIVVETRVHATIKFVTNQDSLIVDDLKGFVGENVTLPTLANIEETIDENTSILKTFVGWVTEDGTLYYEQTFKQANLTLQAKWNVKETKVYSLKIVNNGEVIYSNKVEAHSQFDLSTFDCFNQTTKVYSSADFNESNLVTDFTVEQNSVWYLRNRFKVTVKSNYTTLNGQPYFEEFELYENSALNLSSYSNYSIDNQTFTTEYEFLGYTLNGSLINAGEVITPNGDCTYEASWKVTEWCVVSFDVCWARPSGWIKDGTKKSMSTVSNTNGTNKLKIQRGTSLDFATYYATATYKYGISYDFKIVAWGDTAQNLNVKSYDGASSLVINSNCTLKPIWKAN